MNLRNNQITIGELMQNSNTHAILLTEIPQLAGMLNSPLAHHAQNMTLNAALSYAQQYLPRNKINRLLNRLENA